MKKITLLLFLILTTISIDLKAQVSVGFGTSTGKGIPIEPSYKYTYSQTIYLQSEILAVEAGDITTLTWDFTGTSIDNSNDWTIYIGHTSKTSFEAGNDWVDVSTLTQVFSGNVTLDENNKVVVDITDFAYNNVDNLIIAIDENNEEKDTSGDDFNCFVTETDRSLTYINNVNNPDPTSPPYALFVRNWVPNIVFGGLVSPVSTPSCTENLLPADNETDIEFTDEEITLTWDAPSTGDAPTSYYVFFGTTSGELTNLGSTSETSMIVSGIEYSTTYYWSIVPANAGGISTECATEFSFRTEDPIPPAPNDLFSGAIPIVPSAEGAGCSTFNFGFTADGTTESGMYDTCGGLSIGRDRFYSWTATSEALLWNDGLGEPGIAIWNSAGTSLVTCESSFAPDDTILSGWEIGDELVIQVYDYGNPTNDPAYVDDYSDISFCLAEYTFPEAPDCAENLIPINFSTDVELVNNSVTVSWDMPSGGEPFDSYEVYFGTNSGYLQSIGTTTNTTYTISYLDYATTYYWGVVAVNGGSLSQGCSEHRFTTEDIPSITPPYLHDFSDFPGNLWSEAGNGSIEEGPSGTSGSWSRTSYFAGDPNSENGSSAKVKLHYKNSEDWLISPDFDLTQGTTYFLNLDVALVPSFGSDPTSMGSDDEVHVLILPAGSNTWVSLKKWDAENLPKNPEQEAVEIDVSDYTSKASTVKFAIWATDGLVNDGESYDFFVDNFQITTSSTLSLKDNVIEGLKMYPNPVNEELYFKSQDNNIDELTVYNLLGQEVLKVQPNVLSTEVDMSNLLTGVYIVKVKVGKELGVYRVVKK
ncbi:fibronectin type III domain-containing protein [Polaribacter sargassicola]|uniref:fibronectin type III domain-containing protein n=1 Tax=Polaribacter sargassicola TaxID=2836891 RepID=UPI001F31553C|nr:T9SS type A sorting domain-containing protein [Polaribacter sp. DS7-9]MCG1035324.1 T9SS type A sorting domain-containing protein [Polaribacter sp. DS7-9]